MCRELGFLSMPLTRFPCPGPAYSCHAPPPGAWGTEQWMRLDPWV